MEAYICKENTVFAPCESLNQRECWDSSAILLSRQAQPLLQILLTSPAHGQRQTEHPLFWIPLRLDEVVTFPV